jgi:hypothetical protein
MYSIYYILNKTGPPRMITKYVLCISTHRQLKLFIEIDHLTDVSGDRTTRDRLNRTKFLKDLKDKFGRHTGIYNI